MGMWAFYVRQKVGDEFCVAEALTPQDAEGIRQAMYGVACAGTHTLRISLDGMCDIPIKTRLM